MRTSASMNRRFETTSTGCWKAAYTASSPAAPTAKDISCPKARRKRCSPYAFRRRPAVCPVFAGTGCVGTRDTIRLSRKAADMGADVLSVITPGFAAASQEELYAHYRAVAESVDAPILLYNIPARTGNALAPATVEQLSRIPNIVGVKDSSGNFDNILQYIERTRGSGFVVLSGNDSLILWTLLAGGAGGIAGCANVFPETMTAIYERFLAGDIEGARRAQDAVRPFRDCFRFGNPNTVVKAAVALQGYPVGKCRRPFDRLPEEGLAAVRQVLAELAEQGVR